MIIQKKKIKHMKIYNLLIATLLLGSMLNAQELVRSTVGVSGSSSTVGSGDRQLIVQQSVGQSSVIGYFTNENISIRQGFIQPPIEILGTANDDNNPIDAVLFPNPFSSSVTVAFNEELKENLQITIYDMLGRVVYETSSRAEAQITIDLGFLSSAQYVLLLTSENRQFKANILKN